MQEGCHFWKARHRTGNPGKGQLGGERIASCKPFAPRARPHPRDKTGTSHAGWRDVSGIPPLQPNSFMKPSQFISLRCLPLAAVLSCLPVYGQEEVKPVPADAGRPEASEPAVPVEESSLTTTGSVFSVDADTFSVTPEKVPIPLNFMYSSKTSFVDETDKTVPWDKMRSGLPVTVDYTMLGEKMLATKVTVSRKMIDGGKGNTPSDEAGRKRDQIAEAKLRKDADNAAKAKVSPSSGGGTIMGFEQVIAVRPSGSSDVVQYVVNNSTHYVDTAGQPVALNLVRTGVPVSIQFVEDSGRKIATQFVIQRTTGGAEPRTGGGGTNSSPPNTGARATSPSGTSTTYAGNTGGVVLEDGFTSPPVTVLPSALLTPGTTQSTVAPNGPVAQSGTSTQPGTAFQPSTQPGSTQPATTQPATTQPGTTQPGTTQPGTAQPGTTQPSTTQPGTSQPATPPAAGGNRSGGSAPPASAPSGGRSSAPATPAAPAGRR